MWTPSFFISGQANLLDANLLENRLRLCLNLHPSLVASCFLSGSSHLLMEFPWSRSWTNHLLLIRVSGWASGTRFISVTIPSASQTMFISFHIWNIQGEGWVFSNFITHDKNSVRWNLASLHWPWFCEIVLWLLWSYYAQGWALHRWELEDLVFPRGLKFICTLGWGGDELFVGTLSQDWKIFCLGTFAIPYLWWLVLFFHVCCCCCSFQNECYGEGGGRGVQDGEHMYTHGRFKSIYGKTNTML